MKTTVQPTPNNTERVRMMSESASMAVQNWLESINAPKDVIDLNVMARLLLIYATDLSYGAALTPRMNRALRGYMKLAGKHLHVVGSNYHNDKTPNDMPGTLPRYTLQAIDPDTVSA